MRSPSFWVTAYCQSVSEPLAAIALAMEPASPPSSLSSASLSPTVISSFTVTILNSVSAEAGAAVANTAAASAAPARHWVLVIGVPLDEWISLARSQVSQHPALARGLRHAAQHLDLQDVGFSRR